MIRKLGGLVLALALVVGLIVVPTQAATEDEIKGAIDAGVLWLVDQQQGDGSWGEWEEVAKTGFAVVKLEDRARELGYDSPFDPDYEYSENVTAGLNYIFGQASDGNCGMYFTSEWHPTYDTGISMMAIAASGEMDRVVNVPGSVVDGMTYGEVLEANVAYFANTQGSNGGWDYGSCPPGDWADNSNSGYAVVGLRYAEDAGVEIPQSLKDNLSQWIDYIQNDPGPADDAGNVDPDGGSGYSAGDEYVNVLKTGNLLFQMAFVGDSIEDQRVQDAIGYIERHWNDPFDPGWMPQHYQAMYCLMKGFESLGIETIEVGNSTMDWFDELADVIIDSQQPDGSWPADNWGDELLATEWALLTLEKATPCFPPEVWCVESVNPHGQNVPGKNRSAEAKGKAQNPDGFYQLFAESNCDPEVQVWVGTADSPQLFGPFPSGIVVKITEARGAAPKMKEMGSTKGQAGAVTWHITLPSDPAITAVDYNGNAATCTDCLVPPPPK